MSNDDRYVRKDRSKFTQMLDKNSPFDNINFGIDTKYFDASVGYDRDRGTTLSATLDLNSWGKSDQEALIAAKVEYEREKMKLALERQRLENERFYGMRNGNIPRDPVREAVPYVAEKKPEPKQEEFREKVSVVDNRSEYRTMVQTNSSFMSAKAFLDDEDF